MTPFSDEQSRNSGVSPASSAPHASAEEPAVAPEEPAVAPEGPAVTPEGPAVTPEEPAASPEDGAGSAGASAGSVPAPEAERPADAHDSRTHEQQLERDLDELAAKAQKADEYLELAKRTRADFENYRKRAAREAAAAQERGVVKLVRELLPAVDNLDRALDAIVAANTTANGDDLVSGIKLVHAELIAALSRAGVERFSPEGERFDPERHEALGQQPAEGAESGTIIAVYQRGYRLGDSVIRPARVLVAG